MWIERTKHLLDKNMHFAEMSSGSTNPTELVALLIIQGKNYYYRIFTWKGYEGKDLATTDPLYLNAQGDKGNASLLVLNARFGLALSNRLNLDFNVSNYWRDTHYSYHDDVKSKTFDMSLGLQYKF